MEMEKVRFILVAGIDERVQLDACKGQFILPLHKKIDMSVRNDIFQAVQQLTLTLGGAGLEWTSTFSLAPVHRKS